MSFVVSICLPLMRLLKPMCDHYCLFSFSILPISSDVCLKVETLFSVLFFSSHLPSPHFVSHVDFICLQLMRSQNSLCYPCYLALTKLGLSSVRLKPTAPFAFVLVVSHLIYEPYSFCELGSIYLSATDAIVESTL